MSKVVERVTGLNKKELEREIESLTSQLERSNKTIKGFSDETEGLLEQVAISEMTLRVVRPVLDEQSIKACEKVIEVASTDLRKRLKALNSMTTESSSLKMIVTSMQQALDSIERSIIKEGKINALESFISSASAKEYNIEDTFDITVPQINKLLKDARTIKYSLDAALELKGITS